MSADTQPRVGARDDPLDACVSRSSGLGETQAVRSDQRVVCARSGSAHWTWQCANRGRNDAVEARRSSRAGRCRRGFAAASVTSAGLTNSEHLSATEDRRGRGNAGSHPL